MDKIGVIHSKTFLPRDGHNRKGRFVAKDFLNTVNNYFVKVDVNDFRGTTVVACTLVCCFVVRLQVLVKLRPPAYVRVNGLHVRRGLRYEKICRSVVRPGSISGSVLKMGNLAQLQLSPVHTKIHAIQSCA